MAKKLAEQAPTVSPVEPAPLAAPLPATAPSPPSAPPLAAEISGFGLLWRAFLSWLRGHK
jgi:hypothetical protein